MSKGPIDWEELEEDSSSSFEKSAWKSSRRRRDPSEVRTDGSQAQEDLALVLAVGAKRCTVERGREILECRLPSRLASYQRSGLAVGDRVHLERRRNATWITAVEDRKTALSRPDPRDPRRARVVAANIDRVVVVVALAKPGIRTGLIDRYLLAIEQGGAQPVLCVNKVDLAAAPEQGDLDLLEPYYQLGLPVVLCSATRDQGIEELRRILDGHLSVFVGHSGVGKSSLLNALKPELDLTTAAVRRADGTGRHTTTRSHLYKFAGETWIIDTPGIREFGLWNLEAGEIGSYFPELVEWAPGCKFANCTHSHEPQCAVKQAVDDGQIPVARYEAYLRILASLQD